jgi:hypothetical protein
LAVVLHKPALMDDLDELDYFQILKRLKIVEMKMYVHYQKSAAGFVNRGNSSTLGQMLNQESQTRRNPDMKE